ncbi:hypothetical protein K402DRAFT_396226 [Aulographum hederae CBS 113979]|uniref:Uncharacterized protein n=1 Tax=Aulographum hederae CBS 113979 TaxID=1176131 RepID=A0A6G1GSW1_9PEZI|nr:hypothetical protein K402DRAFT_396226 [Aulographum hederae CBS 113979]
MAASSVGSVIFAILALLIICLSVLLLLRYYLPVRATPAYLFTPVFLALALPSSIVLLVPIDLASSAGTDAHGTRGIWLPDRVMLVSWRICYWLTFMLTWFVLPLLGEYSDSGYREPRDKMLYALRSNARYQLIVLGSAILGAIYFFVTLRFSTESLKGMVMALAYAWGLILAIYLMGHGLVALPRRLFRTASISGRLRRLQAQAAKIHEKLEDALEDLQQYESQVAELRKRKTGSARDFAEWIEELDEYYSQLESRLPSTNALLAVARPALAPPNVITERYLADLTRKLKRARHRRARFELEWSHLVSRAQRDQQILDSAASQRLDFGKPSPYASFLSRASILTPHLRFHLHTYAIPVFNVCFGVVASLASVFIVWSECVKSSAPKLSVIGLTVVHHPESSRGQVGFAGQLLAAAWLCYMIAAALLAVTEVKVWGNRALVRRQTYAESACWYAGQVAKLTVPLSYNFVTFTPKTIFQETQFYHFLGRLVDLTPLGSGFDDFFPIFILFPVAATLFGFYGKAQRVVGFGEVMDDEEDDGTGSGFGLSGWREGRALIEREVSSREGEGVGLDARGASSGAGLLDARYRDEEERISASSTTIRRTSPLPQQRSERAGRRLGPTVADRELATSPAGFFDDIAHRLKNTFDTNDWFDGLKKPNWMNGNGEGGSASSSAQGDSGNGFGRWFGGRDEGGRVHL